MSPQSVVDRRQALSFALATLATTPALASSATPCAATCAPGCPPLGVRPQDNVWAVSTRHLGCGHAFMPQVWHFQAGRWQASTLAAFYASDSEEQVTSTYIHGNRIESGQALADGLGFYHQLIGRYPKERPTRFVIWSWPSSQIKGVRKDVRTKAARTNTEGFFFAEFLAGMSPNVQVGLLGYSFGARIITGGLHLLGGGQLVGRVVPRGNRQPTNVVLWAAALHNYWLLPGRFHGAALPMAQHWLIYVNGCDPVLRHYHRLEKCGDPAALGYTGLAGLNTLPPDLRSRIEQWQVSHIIGETHDVRPYVYSPTVAPRTRQYLLWHSLAAGTAAAGPAKSTGSGLRKGTQLGSIGAGPAEKRPVGAAKSG
jgi:hypothetical protein